MRLKRYYNFRRKSTKHLSINQGEYLSKLSSKFDYIMKTDHLREQLENEENKDLKKEHGSMLIAETEETTE